MSRWDWQSVPITLRTEFVNATPEWQTGGNSFEIDCSLTLNIPHVLVWMFQALIDVSLRSEGLNTSLAPYSGSDSIRGPICCSPCGFPYHAVQSALQMRSGTPAPQSCVPLQSGATNRNIPSRTTLTWAHLGHSSANQQGETHVTHRHGPSDGCKTGAF